MRFSLEIHAAAFIGNITSEKWAFLDLCNFDMRYSPVKNQ